MSYEKRINIYTTQTSRLRVEKNVKNIIYFLYHNHTSRAKNEFPFLCHQRFATWYFSSHTIFFLFSSCSFLFSLLLFCTKKVFNLITYGFLSHCEKKVNAIFFSFLYSLSPSLPLSFLCRWIVGILLNGYASNRKRNKNCRIHFTWQCCNFYSIFLILLFF